MDSAKFMDSISDELTKASEDIQETNELDKKVQLSILIRNLTETMSTFASIPSGGFQAVDVSEEDELEINSVIDAKFE